jgi:hypothetical protein
MIQTGIKTLSGENGSNFFNVIPGINIDNLNLPKTEGGSTAKTNTSKSETKSSGVSLPSGTSGVTPPKSVDVPGWVDSTKISPYFREIRMSSLSAGSTRSQGSVTLKSSSNRAGKINITGWQIKAKNGGIFIPQGVERYFGAGLSVEGDISLAKGDYLTIYTSVSPLGQNIRLNKCMGYLQEEIKFNPSISKQCPRPDVDSVRPYSSGCIDYVRTISTCEVPKSNPPVPYSDYRCREYLQQFNYKGCYSNHYGDANFLSSQWRAWAGALFLNSSHDRVLLLDKQGLVVDYREY